MYHVRIVELHIMAVIICFFASLNVARSVETFPVHIEKFAICLTTASLRGVIAAEDGIWVPLERVQWAFFRTIYINSNENKTHTPPRGTEAAVWVAKDANTAMVVFIEGGNICSGMQVDSAAIKKAIELK